MAEPQPVRRPLTDRELEVVGHLANGDTIAEIAQVMWLAETTIKSHIVRARRSIGARNKLQLCVLAIRSGQLP